MSFYQSLVIPNAQVTSFTNFPIPIRIDGMNTAGDGANPLWAACRSDGADIRFTLDDGTTSLEYFFESWDYANTLATIWVKMPSIAGSTTTTIRMWYGDPTKTITTANYDSVFTKISASESGLIALYHCDEGTGTTLNDSVGTFNANLISAPTWLGSDGGSFKFQPSTQSFASGDAVKLNGIDERIDIPGLWNTQGSNAFSLWIFLRSAPADGASLLEKRNTGSSGIYVQFTSQRTLKWVLQNGGFTNYKGGHQIALNKWTHVAGSYGSGGLRLYVNGEASAMVPGVTFVPSNGSSYPLSIGGDAPGVAGYYVNMDVDEIAFWSGSMPEWKVKNLFSRRPLQHVTGAYEKITRYASNPVIANGDGNHRLEPNVIKDGPTSFKMWLHNNSGSGTCEYYTSSNGINWTLVDNNVFGGNAAGITVLKIGSTYHAFFSASYTGSTTHLQHWTSANATSWTQQANAITATNEAYCNSDWVVLPDTTIIGHAEYRDAADNLFKSRAYAGANFGSLAPVGTPTGFAYAGGPMLYESAGRAIMLSHGSLTPGTGNIPTLGQAHRSTDYLHFQQVCENPVIQLSGPPYEGDQIGDLFALEDGDGAGTLYLYWCGTNDGSTGANIGNGFAVQMGTVANSTLAEWLTDNLNASALEEIQVNSSSSSSSSSSSDSSESSSSDSSESSSSDSSPSSNSSSSSSSDSSASSNSSSSSSSEDDVEVLTFNSTMDLNVFPAILINGEEAGRLRPASGKNSYEYVPSRDYYRAPVTLTIHSAYGNSDIRYTLNGKEPGSKSHQYTGPLKLRHNPSGGSVVTVRARAFDRRNDNNMTQIIGVRIKIV